MARHFNIFFSARWTLVLCLLVAALASGCASKQGALDVEPMGGGQPLTAQESAVVHRNPGIIAGSVPSYARPLVDEQTRFYLRGGRKTMEITSQRAEKYLAYTKGVFRSYGLPEELAYLALVESGYNTKARSHAGAAGAWQFMPYTGMKFGLSRDKWQDERNDIYQATHAAAQYLRVLHDRFGDWPTAIGAYNSGEGKMSRALEAAGERTFFGLLRKNDRLDEETRLRPETCQYVPRFLAMTAIMENLGELGFRPINPGSAPVVAKVTVAPRTSLKGLASASGLTWAEFQEYNPHYLRNVSHDSRTTHAYVPVDAYARAQAFARNPGTTRVLVAGDTARPAVRRTSGSPSFYVLRSGDTMSAVARAHGVSVADLLAANGIRDAHKVHAGQKLRIPGTSTVAVSRQSSGKSADTSSAVSYMVQPNDNLWQISRKLRVSVDDLKRWNNIKGQDIQVGQRLVVMR